MNKHRLFQEIIDYLLKEEGTSYEEYLSEYFPEIDEDMYYDLDTYSRDDLEHIYALALQARDYLLENPVSELGT